GSPQQVVEALLMPGVLELVIGRPAVVDHSAVVVEPQDGLGHGAAAGRVDDVGSGLRSGQRVQPGRGSAHPPAGLVGNHPFGLPHGLADGLVNWLAARGSTQHGVDAAAPTEPNAEEAFQAAGDLAVGEAALLVEFNDSSLGIGPELHSGGPKGIGRLQGMAPLNAALALAALAAVDVKSPVNGLPRKLGLELTGEVGFVEGAAAVGAGAG